MAFEARRRAAAAVVVAVAAWFFMWFRRRVEDSRSVTYGPLAERDMQRMNNLRYIYDSDDVHCVNLLRTRRAPFFQLCDLFHSRELVTDSMHASVEEQVAMFLHVVGNNERFRVVDLTFRRSAETISRFFQKVLYVVGELRNELIVPPATNGHPRILGSKRWYPYFKDCIGAIDGTHVLARVPVKMQAVFRGRKHTITQNVLAAMDFDLRFTYVLAGWEGSTHDALILSDALERDDGLRVPPGKFYLVDAGYAVRPGFLPPFRATRRFHDLVGQGVKTEKGSKEVHVRQVTLMVSEFAGVNVTTQQIYNHLRKWRQRWVKIVRLKDHPADAKFLSTPIENDVQMEAIFGGIQATGRYAMGSNEPLGTPTDIGQGEIDTVEDNTDLGGTEAESRKGTPSSMEGSKGSDANG
ncbi:uncharacterized protein [Miscanthus floridulus]|uniref:uncharacterized protein n=1 Tax=Miscanthus floridulus TaxID=154761 RepID=UPI0034584A28